MKDYKGRSVTLTTKRLTLRVLRPQDATRGYVRGLNDKAVYRYLLLADKGKQTRASVRSYIRQNLVSPSCILFGIFLKESNTLIGTARLSNISFFHYSADVGICLFSREHWHQGYATEALAALVGVSFKTLGLHCLEAGLFRENRSSLQLFRRCGFIGMTHVKDRLRLEDRFADITLLFAYNPAFNTRKLKLRNR